MTKVRYGPCWSGPGIHLVQSSASPGRVTSKYPMNLADVRFVLECFYYNYDLRVSLNFLVLGHFCLFGDQNVYVYCLQVS